MHKLIGIILHQNAPVLLITVVGSVFVNTPEYVSILYFYVTCTHTHTHTRVQQSPVIMTKGGFKKKKRMRRFRGHVPRLWSSCRLVLPRLRSLFKFTIYWCACPTRLELPASEGCILISYSILCMLYILLLYVGTSKIVNNDTLNSSIWHKLYHVHV